MEFKCEKVEAAENVNSSEKKATKALDATVCHRIFKQLSHGKRKLLQSYKNQQEGLTKKYKTMETFKDESSSGSFNRDNYRNSGDRPPKGLKGREIGLWYKNRQMTRKRNGWVKSEERSNNHEKKGNRITHFKITLPSDVINNVEELLHRNKSNEEEFYSSEFIKFLDSTLKISFDDHVKKILEGKIEKERDEELDGKLLSELGDIEKSEEFQKILSTRKNLPMFGKREEFLNAMQNNQVILVSGDTGCGKTTQVPQFILDFYIKNKTGSLCNIVCTQPRRIAAITVSERVAWERVEKLGKSVGYQIRLENVLPRKRGSILYCTTGTLLRQMESDPMLEKISHIILDEIHERSVETDILMAVLKKVCPHRRDLKVILMSATFCVEDFSHYFDDCPIITVSGTLFPVEEKYLEDVLEEIKFHNFSDRRSKEKKWSKYTRKYQDPNIEFMNIIEPYVKSIKNKYSNSVIQSISKPTSEEINIDLLCDLVFNISTNKPDGAILVFLPSYDTISKLYKMITESQLFRIRKYLVYPLHSMMPTADQKMIFERPPSGVRKIIIATNIAETSITIDDVVYVINSGKIKMQDYDIEKNFVTLGEKWVTLANSKQRKGRAGRVQSGICYHLYTRAREKLLDEFPTPEILRSKLDGIILNLKLLRINDVRVFFSTLLNVPHSSIVENSMKLLKRLNAIDEQEFITPLGLHLARLPLDPQMGKMILMATIFKCVYPITSCAASLSFKDAFYVPLGKEKEVDKIKHKFADGTKSDHLMLANVLEDLREAKEVHNERNFCYENYLSLTTLNQLEKMKGQFCDILQASCFLTNRNPRDPTNNLNSSNENLLRAVICAGLYPNIAFLKRVKRIKNRVRVVHNINTPEDGKVSFHPCSVNSNESEFESRFFVYYKKQKSTALYLYDTTMVHPLALILFGDSIKAGVNDYNKSYISVANEYAFECNEDTSRILIELRNRMEALLQKKTLHPGPINDNTADADLLQAIVFLLTTKTQRYDTEEESE